MKKGLHYNTTEFNKKQSKMKYIMKNKQINKQKENKETSEINILP